MWTGSSAKSWSITKGNPTGMGGRSYEPNAKVASAIAPVQGRAHEILNLRYITGLSMGQIARALHLPRFTVYRLHDRAVQSIQ